MDTQKKTPKCWIDEKNVPAFRNDLTPDEALELNAIMGQAFEAGVRHGYTTAMERAA